MTNRWLWIFIALLSFGIYQNFPLHHLRPGILAPADPEIILVDSVTPFKVKRGEEYTITPLATFQMRARVLHTHHYWFDRESDLSPVDFAMGWGAMSDQALLKQISIDQGARWYTFEYDHALPVSNDYVYQHSGNMHMIPSTDHIAKILKSVQANEIIDVEGYLIRADSPDGYHWQSSLSLKDKGENSCKVIWVTDIRIEEGK